LTDDHKGTFASENLPQKKIEAKTLYGCIAESNRKVQLINSKGVEGASHLIYPCFEHLTLADLLDAKSVTWRYYTPGAGDIWSAPDAIKHICQPSGRLCTGPLWQNNVALSPPDVLEDLSICNLRDVSWVIPSAQYSDHPKINTGLGPSWVAAVVNAIGNSRCRDADGSSYWDSTAILLTWDDWGGWYDHEPPTFLPYPEGGYQYGFRVPFIFISAYSPRQFINNQRLDFGSVARFIEFNFGITMGALTFSDARSGHDLSSFYDFGLAARSFQTVPAPPFPADAAKMKLEPPDDD
jgi:phospholipase C